MRKIMLLFLVLFILGTGTGCTSKGQDVSYSGRIEATEIDIHPEVGGVIKSLWVSEGDHVKKGQLLAELDGESLVLELKRAEAAVEKAQARLEEAFSGARSQEIEGAKAEIKNIQARLQQAKKDLEFFKEREERYRNLMEAGAVSKQTYEDIQHALEKARNGVEVLKTSLTKARSRLDLLEAGNTANYIQMLQAELKQAVALKKQIELQLQKTRIYSPQSGVVELKNFEVGELVRKGDNLMTIIDLKDQWVNIYVPQTELGYWHLGDRVKLVADAFPGKTFSGVVVYIASEAEFTPKNIQTKEARADTVFRIKIRVQQGLEKLRPGMWVEVLRGEE